MAKLKVPFKKHKLRPIRREEYSPPPDRPEPTASNRRGYWPGSRYDDAERAWLKAVERFQKRTGRKFLSHVDYLRLARTIGYIHRSEAHPVNAQQVIDRMAALGFVFTIDADGDVSFAPPPDTRDTPAVQELLGMVAWSWGWLAPAALEYVRAHPQEAKPCPTPNRPTETATAPAAPSPSA